VTPAWLLLTNLVATWYMVGLIWMVQMVHYHMFDRVGKDVFSQYAAEHSRLITPIVGVPMLIEIASAAALMVLVPTGVSRWLMIVGFVIVCLIWLSTAFVQVPCHTVLASGFDQAAYRRLVDTNWIRTVLWSVRGVLMMLATARLLTQ